MRRAPALNPLSKFCDEKALKKSQAAQGTIVHDDDTYVRILALMGKRRADLLSRGELENPERTGLFTTAIPLRTTAVVRGELAR